jgi:hypothetical protein
MSLLVAGIILPALLLSPAPASAQASSTPAQAGTQTALPHAWLFGSWVGGLFPPPVSLSGQECLASPTVIFTRDAVLRASPTDVTYNQSLVETVRAVSGGFEFRLAQPAQSAASTGAFGMAPDPAGTNAGFGCTDPSLLRVQRRGEDMISFPNCPEFPYPLVRCPSR